MRSAAVNAMAKLDAEFASPAIASALISALEDVSLNVRRDAARAVYYLQGIGVRIFRAANGAYIQTVTELGRQVNYGPGIGSRES
jgi:HEAT repeat protein